MINKRRTPQDLNLKCGSIYRTKYNGTPVLLLATKLWEKAHSPNVDAVIWFSALIPEGVCMNINLLYMEDDGSYDDSIADHIELVTTKTNLLASLVDKLLDKPF